MVPYLWSLRHEVKGADEAEHHEQQKATHGLRRLGADYCNRGKGTHSRQVITSQSRPRHV